MPRGIDVKQLIGLLGLPLLLLAGCATPEKSAAPPFETPEKFAVAGSLEAPTQWWTAFDDPRLNRMVDTALASNFNLKIAWQRLQESRAIVDRESGALFPDLQASLFGATTRNTDTSPTSNAVESGFEAGLGTSYEVDLWGRVRSQVRAEKYRARASYADYQVAAITLSAEITNTWYRLTEARSELRLVQRQIETNETVLNLLENRFGTGQIRSVDILRQRQLLESTREQKANVEARVEVLEHQLSVLLGRVPQKKVALSRKKLPDLPPLPETGVPIELVERRPDVKRAFRQLKAADQDLAAAISNQYPRLTLTASATTAAENAENLFREWALSFSGNLLAPVFRGGELRAEVDRTEAVKKQRLYAYAQTVLTAFQEVENALVQEKKQRERIESLERQVKLARQSYEQLRLEYFNGISDYLDVLTALDEVQQLRRDLLSARLTLVEYRIALYRSLAGPFDTDRETELRAES